jgi:Do/DeqQ family serine protease
MAQDKTLFFKTFSRTFLGTFFIVSLVLSHSFAASSSDEDKVKRPKRGSLALGTGSKLKSPGLPAQELNKLFTNISKQTAKSVVSVNTFTRQSAVNPHQRMWEEFFGIPQKRRPQQRNQEVPLGIGSGFIVSDKGYIITNQHVVQNASRVRVTLHNKKSYEAEIVGTDKKTDIAVLKIDAPRKEVSPLAFGNSDKLQIGEWVLAIGNPFGYENTVTAGIVSAKGRRNQMRSRDSYQNYIQTDAAVNPGNSGGPLVNLYGEVVGINTLIISRSGGYQGLSFAIPIRMAKKVAEDLIYEGKVIRGFLGVQIADVPSELALALDLEPGQGAKVEDLVPNGPADRANIQPSDIILSIDGTDIEDASHLRNFIAELEPGKKYPFVVLREGNKITLNAKIGSRDKVIEDDEEEAAPINGSEYATSKLGFKYETLGAEKRKLWELRKDLKGALITEITDSRLQGLLSKGDVITRYKRKKDARFVSVSNAQELYKVLKGLKSEESIAFYIHSQGKDRLIALRAKKSKK